MILNKIHFAIWFILLIVLSSCTNNTPTSTLKTTPSPIVENNIVQREDTISNDVASIEKSTRHQEWVEIDNNGKTIYTWVVYPEVSTPTNVVVMIHENKWLTDWVRNMADEVAEKWNIVIAPDLLSSFSEEKKKTSDFETTDAATQALYSLDKDSVVSDINAVIDYAKWIEASNGNIISAWFCWWGSQSFLMATKNSDLKASLVFYGTAPEDESLYENINVPVIGFYGWNDNRVNSTLETTKSYIEKYGKDFSYEMYDGAGHAYMRTWLDDDATPENKKAREESLEKMISILDEYNGKNNDESSTIKEFYMESFTEVIDGKYFPQFSQKELVVNQWDTVKITVKVTKWTHDFKIDEFDVYTETPLDEEVTIEFVADKKWEFVYRCTKPNHRQNGHWWTLIVQ